MMLKILISLGLNNFWGYLLFKVVYLIPACFILMLFRRWMKVSGKQWRYHILFRYCHIVLLIGYLLVEVKWPLWVWLQLTIGLSGAYAIADTINLFFIAGYILFFLYQSYLLASTSGAVFSGFRSYLAQYGYIWLFVVNLIVFLRFDYYYLPSIPGNQTWYQLTLIEFGVLVFFLFLQLGVLQLRKLRMTKAAPELRKLLDEVSERFKIKVKVIRIWRLDGVKNAFASGLFVKSIFLTELLVRTASPEDLRMILGHECAHLKKRHLMIRVAVILLLVGIGSMLVEDYFDFHWLVYTLYFIFAFIIYKGISRIQEFRADALAAKLLGGGRPMADALFRVFGGNSRKFGGIYKLLLGHPDLESRIKKLGI